MINMIRTDNTRVQFCGTYKVDNPKKELGKGSYAIVYLGYSNINEQVAIKVIKKFDMLKDNTKMIANEIGIMNFIKDNPHKNIVKCLDILEDGYNVYIIMEYCNTGTLHELLEGVKKTESKCLSEYFAKYYFVQIIDGIMFLKANNIVHRDIKTKNILLNDNKTIKIADFGLAKKFNKAASLSATICGSPLSMAPEILTKCINRNLITQYDDTVDIWSLGIILYQLIYGKNPYNIEVGEIGDIYSKLKGSGINFPAIDITPDCLNLLKSMLQVDPSRRISWDNLFFHPWITNLGYSIISQATFQFPVNDKIYDHDCTVIENYLDNLNGSYDETGGALFDIEV
jgi:serine/threonine protein kinase